MLRCHDVPSACYTFPICVQEVVEFSTRSNLPSSGVPWLASQTPRGYRIINQVPKIILCLNLYGRAYTNLQPAYKIITQEL